MADKHNIQKGNLHTYCKLLPYHIVCKITQRNNIKRANTCDSLLKLLNEEITPDIQKQFIANYIKGRKTYRNHTSIQRQFKTGIPQGGVLSPILFNIYTSDLPPPRVTVQCMAYADDITITSTHTSTSAANKYIQPYLHKVFAWTKH